MNMNDGFGIFPTFPILDGTVRLEITALLATFFHFFCLLFGALRNPNWLGVFFYRNNLYKDPQL
jgi:hypothetical protein